MPTIVMDLDGTLTLDDHTLTYPRRLPNAESGGNVRKYRVQGYHFAI